MNEIKASAAQKKWLPIILGMAIFMQMLDSTILNTALPSMAKDLHTSTFNMHLVVISYALTLALVMPISAYLSDHFGTQKIFICAIVLFSLGSLFCSMSPNIEVLIASRIIQGIGGAMMTPVARLALLKTFKKSEWLIALNYAVMPALIAPVIGPLVGGYLVEISSWHWIFIINIPIGLIGIVFSLKYLPNYTRSATTLDFSGYIMFAIAAFMLTLGLDFIGHAGTFSWIFIIIIIGCLFFWLYIVHAKKSQDALFPISLFYVRTFRIGIIGNLFSRLGISSFPILLPMLLQTVFHYSPSQAGWMLAPVALASIAIKPFIPRLIHHFGYRTVLTGNTIAIAILMASLCFAQESIPFYIYLPFLLLIGISNSIQFSSMNTITIADLRDYHSSSGNSLMAVNQQLALSFGIAFSASLLRFSYNQPYLANGNEHLAFQYTFITLALITFLSSFIFGRLHQHDGDNLANK